MMMATHLRNSNVRNNATPVMNGNRSCYNDYNNNNDNNVVAPTNNLRIPHGRDLDNSLSHGTQNQQSSPLPSPSSARIQTAEAMTMTMPVPSPFCSETSLQPFVPSHNQQQQQQQEQYWHYQHHEKQARYIFSNENNNVNDKDSTMSMTMSTMTRSSSSTNSLEPTPIGHKGISIVDFLPLSSFSTMESHQGWMDDLRAIITPSTAATATATATATGSSDARIKTSGENGNGSGNRNGTSTYAPSPAVMTVHAQEDLLFEPRTFLLTALEQCESTLNRLDPHHELTVPTQVTSFVAKQEQQAERAARGGTGTTSTAGTTCTVNSRSGPTNSEPWNEKYQELIQFKAKHGHCHVPNSWSSDKPLAHWVRRQRHQYRLKMEGKHSTLCPIRQGILEDLDFIWDSHAAIWEERFQDLKKFQQDHGHCKVPRPYPSNARLAIWVKCQRRQFQLYKLGDKTSMTRERMERLHSLGFLWNIRGNRDASSLAIATKHAAAMASRRQRSDHGGAVASSHTNNESSHQGLSQQQPQHQHQHQQFITMVQDQQPQIVHL